MRRKGMIHLAGLEAWKESAFEWREGVLDIFNAHEAFRNPYPAIEAVMEGSTYERASVMPPGTDARGLAPQETYKPFFTTWYDEEKATAARADDAWDEAVELAGQERNTEFEWFQEFGTNRSDYPRGEWKAGSVDVDGLKQAIEGLPDVLTQLAAVFTLLVNHRQLEDLDFIDLRLRDWTDFDGVDQTTLESDKGRTAEVANTTGWITDGSAEIAWVAASAESAAQVNLARAILEGLTTSAPRGEMAVIVEQSVSVWHAGSQSKKRGE